MVDFIAPPPRSIATVSIGGTWAGKREAGATIGANGVGVFGAATISVRWPRRRRGATLRRGPNCPRKGNALSDRVPAQ
jgi:hypothetical protein